MERRVPDTSKLRSRTGGPHIVRSSDILDDDDRGGGRGTGCDPRPGDIVIVPGSALAAGALAFIMVALLTEACGVVAIRHSVFDRPRGDGVTLAPRPISGAWRSRAGRSRVRGGRQRRATADAASPSPRGRSCPPWPDR